jgi:TonB family protein
MLFQTASRLLMLTVLASISIQTTETAAFPKQDVSQPSGSAQVPKVSCGMQLLTNTEGVDFGRYLEEVYRSVKKSWFANMPPSVEKGKQGANQVEFRVLQGGNIPKDSLKVVVSSQKSDFDAASVQAIREAAPFRHLPEKFSQPFIVMRFTFYYNLAPMKPQ